MAAALAALLLPLVGCGADDGGSELSATPVDPPFEVGGETLTDTSGEPYSLVGDADRPLTLVFFGYTRCPDICQRVMGALASAMTRLDDGDRARVDVVMVTTDPARDDPATLRAYLDRLDPQFEGLTGELPDIVRLGRSVGVFVADAEEQAGQEYDPGSHGSQVIGMRRDGRAPVFWNQDISSARLAEDVHALLEAAG